MRVVAVSVMVFFVFALSAKAVHAQALDPMVLHTSIQDAALAESRGSIAINMSAGAGNAQANLAVIGIGNGESNTAIRHRASVAGSMQESRQGAVAEIHRDAFRNASGIIAVNQSSGAGNAQSNLVTIAMGGLSEVSVEQLGGVVAEQDAASASTAAEGETPMRRSSIADSAFVGASGLVQVNQLAGMGNNTSNSFTLRIAPITK